MPDTDDDDIIIIRRPSVLRRMRDGIATFGSWLAACWRRITGG